MSVELGEVKWKFADNFPEVLFIYKRWTEFLLTGPAASFKRRQNHFPSISGNTFITFLFNCSLFGDVESYRFDRRGIISTMLNILRISAFSSARSPVAVRDQRYHHILTKNGTFWSKILNMRTGDSWMTNVRGLWKSSISCTTCYYFIRSRLRYSGVHSFQLFRSYWDIRFFAITFDTVQLICRSSSFLLPCTTTVAMYIMVGCHCVFLCM